MRLSPISTLDQQNCEYIKIHIPDSSSGGQQAQIKATPPPPFAEVWGWHHMYMHRPQSLSHVETKLRVHQFLIQWYLRNLLWKKWYTRNLRSRLLASLHDLILQVSGRFENGHVSACNIGAWNHALNIDFMKQFEAKSASLERGGLEKALRIANRLLRCACYWCQKSPDSESNTVWWRNLRAESSEILKVLISYVHQA